MGPFYGERLWICMKVFAIIETLDGQIKSLNV